MTNKEKHNQMISYMIGGSVSLCAATLIARTGDLNCSAQESCSKCKEKSAEWLAEEYEGGE